MGMVLSRAIFNLANAGAQSYLHALLFKPWFMVLIALVMPLSDGAAASFAEQHCDAFASNLKPNSSHHTSKASFASIEHDASLFDNVTSQESAHANSQLGKKPTYLTGKLTSGFNEGFQLALGGIFSQGVNFQNTATIDVNNLFADGDLLRFVGTNHYDTGTSKRDWLGAFNYVKPLLSWEGGKLVGTVGYHIWQFPSVLNSDKILSVLDSGLIWTHQGPVSLMLDANVKTLLVGPRGVGGQVYYIRGTASHPIIHKPELSLALVHGPSYAYANGILGIHGHRIIRYEVGMTLQYGNWGVESIYRPQFALQNGIPENRFWGFDIIYLFK